MHLCLLRLLLQIWDLHSWLHQDFCLLVLSLHLFFYKRNTENTLDLQFRGIMILAVTNNALPFVLFSYASLGANSNMLAILNGSTAFITMLIAYFWLNEKISLTQVVGLLLGFLGILVLVNPANASTTLTSSLACLFAASCYSFSSNYIQKYAKDANKFCACWLVFIVWWISYCADRIYEYA